MEMQYNLKIKMRSTLEKTIKDFTKLHPSQYIVIKDEKTNRIIVEIKGTLEFEFVKGTKLFSVTTKETPEGNLPITLLPHQFKVNNDGTVTVYHKENINPVRAKINDKKRTKTTRKKKNRCKTKK